MTTEMDGDGNDEVQSKVGRCIRKYDLDEMGAKLERSWQGDGTERRSLRDLASWFNEHVVGAAMTDAGLDPVDGERENTYRLLAGDEGTSGSRTRVSRRLERAGVDVDELCGDFVSHQAIHTYLTDVRGAAHEPTTERDPVERGTETVQRLLGRTRSVAETTIDDLDSADHVSIGEYDVIANVQVTCRDCGARYDVGTFLQGGSCECEE